MFSPTLVDLTNGIRAAAMNLYDAAGNILSGFDPSRPANSTLSQVPYAAGSQPLLAANAARRKYRVYNPTNKTVYIAEGPTAASLTAYSEAIPQNTSFVSQLNDYTGPVWVIWSAVPANGPVLQVTETTT